MIDYKQFFWIFGGRRPIAGEAPRRALQAKELQLAEDPMETFPATLDEVRAFRAFMPTAAATLSDR